MGRRPKDKNVKFVHDTNLGLLQFLGRLLILIGQPLFLLFSYLFLATISLIYITGFSFRKLMDLFSAGYPKLTKIFQKKLKLVKKLSFYLPKRRLKTYGVIFDAARKKLATKTKPQVWTTFLFKVANTFFSLQVKLLAQTFKTLATIVGLSFKFIVILTLKARLYVIASGKSIQNLPIFKVAKLKLLTYLFGFSFFMLGVGLISFWFFILKDLPSPNVLAQRRIPVSTKIYDRNGTLLYTIFKDQKRTPVSLEEIPLQVRLATIAAEDAEFYDHPGFSIKGIARALVRNIKNREISGGSTITQQLVKNTLLSPEKTVVRKLKEISLAVAVEFNFSKDQILEMYLNEVSYGGTAYGIQEAARTYFNKDISKLNLAEAALLAGLPRSPTRYSPFGPNPELARQRQREVLRLMQINGFITRDQEVKAAEEEIKFAQNKTPILAPHFVFYVREELEEKYGKEMVEAGGLEVVTTLNYQIQQLAEKVVNEEIEKLASLNVTNAAVVVLNPKTGEILAMVGSKDYFDKQADGNVNVAVRPRQPGSAIKVVNYANALSNGMTAATILNDSPITFNVEGQPPYTPKNYEGGYRGNITLRSALAESRNIPAVKTLGIFGVESMVEMGRKMGITTWQNPDNYGLSLTLGGGEVKLIDLARVYATLANYGKRPNINSVLKVTDYRGNVLEESSCNVEQVNQVRLVNQQEKNNSVTRLTDQLINSAQASESALKNVELDTKDCEGEQVLDPRVAFIITDILRDNNARAPSFGTNSLLVIPNHTEVAVKTGTSNDLKDNLAVGYTQDYVVAVWVGNNDTSPMARIASGVTGATPIWNKITSALLAEKGNHDWPIPEKLVRLPICPYTGTLACSGCPVKLEWFLEENTPKSACKPEWFTKVEDLVSEVETSEKPQETSKNNRLPNSGWVIDNILEKRFGKQNNKNFRN